MERDISRVRFMGQLREFLSSMGQPLGRPPALAGKELDLHKLYLTVVGLGGYQHVTQEKLWVQVAQGLKLRQATQCAARSSRVRPSGRVSRPPRSTHLAARPGRAGARTRCASTTPSCSCSTR